MIDYGGGDNDDNNADDGYNGSPPFPIVNQSLDQELLKPFSLSKSNAFLTGGGETNDPTPDVKLLAWKWGKGEKG